MKRAIVILLTLLVLFCAGLEVVTRAFHARISQIKGRIEAEHRAALDVGRSAEPGPEVLILGNSLLLHGVNFPELKRSLARDVTPTRFVIESTGFIDWYYGLRHIFGRGARPSAIVLVLTPAQFLSTHIQGDLFANVLLERSDVLRVSREVGATRTEVTGLMLATVSQFYGNRTEIRNWALHKALPSADELRLALQPRAGPVVEDPGAVSVAVERMNRIQDLTRSYGAEFVLIIPPQLSTEGLDVIERAAAQTHTTLWIPLRPGTVPASSFFDGSHLNAAGASEFTPVLAEKLRQKFLGSTSVAGGSSARSVGLTAQPAPGPTQ